MADLRITRDGSTWRAHDATGRELGAMALDGDGDVVFTARLASGPALDAVRRALQHEVGEERARREREVSRG